MRALLLSPRCGVSLLAALLAWQPCLAQKKAAPAGLSADAARLIADPTGGSTADVLAALRTEQQLLLAATQVAAAGDIPGCWQMLTADLADPGLSASRRGGSAAAAKRVGWRVVSVAGFLNNQERYGAAMKLARLALDEAWWRQTPGDEVRYWCALLASDRLHDHAQALQWLGAAKAGDTPAAKRLRDKLETIEKAHARRG